LFGDAIRGLRRRPRLAGSVRPGRVTAGLCGTLNASPSLMPNTLNPRTLYDQRRPRREKPCGLSSEPPVRRPILRPGEIEKGPRLSLRRRFLGLLCRVNVFLASKSQACAINGRIFLSREQTCFGARRMRSSSLKLSYLPHDCLPDQNTGNGGYVARPFYREERRLASQCRDWIPIHSGPSSALSKHQPTTKLPDVL